MLYVFYGTDVIGVRARAHACVRAHAVEEDSVTHISPENYDPGALRALAGASSLFAGKEVVLIDTLSAEPELFEALLEDVPLLGESTNIFVVIEHGLLAQSKKVFAQAAREMIEVKRPEQESFSPFALSDALLRRDKKSLWILLAEAWSQGRAAEEIVGTLFWQIKILRLAERTKTPEEAGQKAFVYNKAKRALPLFKKGELDRFSEELVSMYHEGHMGKRDIELALERWILNM